MITQQTKQQIQQIQQTKFNWGSNSKIRKRCKNALSVFTVNQMKVSTEKCPFLLAQTVKLVWLLKNKKMKNSKFKKLLGIKLDSKLNLNSHIHDICQKAGQKLNAISRITP